MHIPSQLAELRKQESLWDVDGDLLGLAPGHILPDTLLSVDALFVPPKETGEDMSPLAANHLA